MGRRKKTVVPVPPRDATAELKAFIDRKVYYLKNCMYWINEYQEGKKDLKEFEKTISHIRNHAVEMLQRIKSE